MTMTPDYIEYSVPEDLQRSVHRIMCATLDTAGDITIPARPTGYVYIGWFPSGTASAQANGNAFELAQNQVHISGQLTTFDATFTLSGPCVHYLAECKADGAYRLLGRDMGLLRNMCDVQDGPEAGEDSHATFLTILRQFGQAHIVDPAITTAVDRIEATDGNVNIAELSDELSMHERQLRRQFTKIVGLPPKSFAVIRRVLSALHVLAENPTLDLADIAIQAGFADQAHMTKMFQQYLLSSPSKLEIDDDGVLRSIVAPAGKKG